MNDFNTTYKQKDLLNKYSNYLNKEGIICIVFPDDMNKEHFMGLIDCKLIEEITVKYVPKISGDFTFELIVVSKA